MAEHPERPKDLDKVRNTLERRAHLIVDLLEDRAQRIVDNLDEPPPGTSEQDPATVRAMWSFSPYAERAADVFWMLHDATLDQLLAAIAQSQVRGDDRMKALRAAYQKAELVALERVYPQRVTLMLLGVTTPERSVALAEKAQRLVEQDEQRRPRREQQQEAMAY